MIKTLLLVFVMLVQTSRCIVYRCDTMAACGCSRNPAILSRIVGGEAAGNGTWGSAVSIFIAGRLLCGGSIVSESWIISAAHCFHGYTASDVVIYAGSNGIFEGSQIRNASRVIIHPQYSTTTVINDIALIKLESPLLMNDSNINAICLPSAAQGSSTGNEWPIANTSVVVVGWGKLKFDGPVSPKLQQVTLQTVDYRAPACSQLTSNWRTQVCAGIPGSGKDTCQGDSGGPLMYFDSSNRWILIGLTSYGDSCPSANYSSVYTRVAAFQDWIGTTMNSAMSHQVSTTFSFSMVVLIMVIIM